MYNTIHIARSMEGRILAISLGWVVFSKTFPFSCGLFPEHVADAACAILLSANAEQLVVPMRLNKVIWRKPCSPMISHGRFLWGTKTKYLSAPLQSRHCKIHPWQVFEFAVHSAYTVPSLRTTEAILLYSRSSKLRHDAAKIHIAVRPTPSATIH